MTTTCTDEIVASLENTRRIEYRAFYDSRVAAGVAYLDGAVPEWRERIDVETLDLMSGGRCVLAQVYATNYFRARGAIAQKDGTTLPADIWDLPGSTYWCERRGFTVTLSATQAADISDDSVRDEQLRWRTLQAAWVAELTRPA